MLRQLVTILTFGSLTAAAATPPALSPAAAAPLTAEELFRSFSLNYAELSSDGRHLGTIITDEKDLHHLLVTDLKDFKRDGLRSEDGFNLSSFRWLDNDHVLLGATKDKIYSVGLFVAKLGQMDAPKPVNLYDVSRIIGIPRARPGSVLVWIVQSAKNQGQPGALVELDTSRTPDPSFGRSNIGSSDYAVVFTYSPPARGTVIGWQSNQAGDLALCFTWLDGQPHLHRYLRAKYAWADVPLDLKAANPMALDPDDRFLWVVTHSSDHGFALRRLNLDTGELAAPVHSDPLYDPSHGRLYFSTQTGELAGLSYLRSKPTTIWFSKEYAAVQATLDYQHPDMVNLLLDHDRAERKFLFHVSSPQNPGSYELLDLDAKRLNHLADTAPWLKDRSFRPVQTISFRTRDGVKLEGYLTLPAGADEKHPAPMVVLAHGGPWVRDTPDFNPEVQFLAGDGYAVLQPNYRGSIGYAPAISGGHDFDFRRMHDDVTDATKAILTSGLIDPKRVAIMGASFGGYLALAGVTFEKDLYRCAITACGVFDWERHIKSKRGLARPGEYEQLLDMLGRPGGNQESLALISPLSQAEKIHVPVFIAHGVEDNIVDVTQSNLLVAALEKGGVPHETFFRPLEGHGFYNYQDRVDYYRRVEGFLAQNLGNGLVPSVK